MPFGDLAHRLDGSGRAVMGQPETGVHHGAGARTRRHRRGDRCGEHTGRLTSVARLMGARHLDGLAVRRLWTARVEDTDRRHVHGRATVDDVADPGLAGIGVRMVQPQHQPLLRQEQPLQGWCLDLQLGDPDEGVPQLGHEVLRDGVGVEVVPDLAVDPDQRVDHQRVVGDAAVAVVERRQRPGLAPVLVVGTHHSLDGTAVPRGDLVGRPPFGGTAEGVAHGPTRQAAPGPVTEFAHGRTSLVAGAGTVTRPSGRTSYLYTRIGHKLSKRQAVPVVRLVTTAARRGTPRR